MTDADIDQAVNRAEDLIDEPITLAKILPQISLEIPTDILRQSISRRIVTDTDGVPAFELFFPDRSDRAVPQSDP